MTSCSWLTVKIQKPCMNMMMKMIWARGNRKKKTSQNRSRRSIHDRRCCIALGGGLCSTTTPGKHQPLATLRDSLALLFIYSQLASCGTCIGLLSQLRKHLLVGFCIRFSQSLHWYFQHIRNFYFDIIYTNSNIISYSKTNQY